MENYNSKVFYQVKMFITWLKSLIKILILNYLNIGQQLIQLPDGKLHVTSYINPSPSRTVQIGKNTILANNNNFQKAGTQVGFNL